MQFAPGAYKYALVVGALAVIGLVIAPLLGIGLGILSVGVLWFYRDPDRSVPDSGIVAPADGRVQQVTGENGQVRVSIFMNVTDVHVNRAVTVGTVTSITRESGGHRPAFLPGARKNATVIIDFDSYNLTLITGSIARRITTYVSVNDTVSRGERVGHIAFGSRVDVRLPESIRRRDILVSEGDSVRAGESVLALSPEDVDVSSE